MWIRVLLIICTINVSNQNNVNELIEDEEGCAIPEYARLVMSLFITIIIFSKCVRFP